MQHQPSVLPPQPSQLVGQQVRYMQTLTGGPTGCSEPSSPFWRPDNGLSEYQCTSCNFGVDPTRDLKYGCGQKRQVSTGCGALPCTLPTRSLDDAFEDIGVKSYVTAMYGASLPNVVLSSKKFSSLPSLRAAPCVGTPQDPNQMVQNIQLSTQGDMAMVASARFTVF